MTKIFVTSYPLFDLNDVWHATQWAKSTKKQSCRSVFLTIWHCILSAEPN